MSQLARAPLQPWYVHGQPRVPILGALGKWSHLIHTLEGPGCRMLQNKLVHRSHECHASGTEAGGGSYLQQRWPKRGRRWLPWCGPHCPTHLAVPAGCLMLVCGSGLAAAAGPHDGRCPACAGGRRCLQTGLLSLLAANVRSESSSPLHEPPFLPVHARSSSCQCEGLALFPQAWGGGKLSSLRPGSFSPNCSPSYLSL